MVKVLKWIGRIFTLILLLILCSNVYIMISRSFFGVRMPTVFGFSNAIVVTGSMEPAVHVNDMVIIHAREEYQVGDIVTYLPADEGTPITHRIKEMNGDTAVTQGDANNTADPAIKTEQIVGKVILTIPHAGAVIGWISTPLGMMVLILSGFAIVGAVNVIESVRDKKKKQSGGN